jgi:hypothetical protein
MKKNQSECKLICFLIFAFLLVSSVSVDASDISSTHFIIRDPSIGTVGGYQSSGSFKLYGSGNSIFSGFGSSLSFMSNYGFLYFPFINSGTLSGSVNSSDMNLSWTPSTAGHGFTVSGYRIGKSSTSGSGYVYNTVGNVTTVIYASQPAGTYYFVVDTLDGFGSVATTSNEIVLTVSSTAIPPTSTGGGGGGGGGGTTISTGANFSGRAYPGSKVFLLKDGQIAVSTVAGGDANFTINLSGLSAGDFVFVIYAEDQAGRRSTLFTYPLTLTPGATSEISGIFISPTIATDKEEVKKGDTITIIGQSVPNSEVTISVHSSPEIFVRASSDKYGGYVYNFDTAILDMGDHLTKSKSVKLNDISPYGRAIGFKVGDKTVYAEKSVPIKSDDPATTGSCAKMLVDLNSDCRVNLFDYSILAFWYKKPSIRTGVDLNHDGKVDIVDFSIMAHYWTI